MNEFFSAVRSIHILLIAISATIIAFSTAPDDSELYKAAQIEADFLAIYDFRDRGWQDILIKASDDLTVELRKEYAKKLSASPWNLSMDSEDIFWLDVTIYLGNPPEDATLGQIRRFTDSKREMQYVGVPLGGDDPTGPPSNLYDVFGSKRLKKAAHCYKNGKISQCPLLVPGGRLIKTKIIELPPYSSPDKESRIDGDRLLLTYVDRKRLTQIFSVVDKNGRQIDFSPPPKTSTYYLSAGNQALPCLWLWTVRTSDSQKNDHPHFEDLKKFRFNGSEYSPCFSSNPILGFEYNNAFETLFPNLFTLWYEIEDLTPKKASSYLSNKTTQARRSINIGGLSADGRIVATVAPLAVLSFSIYMLAHLSMLRLAIARVDQDDRTAYPWLCLYSDRLSKTVTIITVAVLPIFAVLVSMPSAGWNLGFVLAGPISIIGVSISSTLSIKMLYDIRQLLP